MTVFEQYKKTQERWLKARKDGDTELMKLYEGIGKKLKDYLEKPKDLFENAKEIFK